MTIIKKINSLVNYPITHIPPDVLDLIQRAHAAACADNHIHAPHLVTLLEAFFHVTGFQVSYLGLSTPDFETAARGFAGALLDQVIIQASSSTRRRYFRCFIQTLEKMREEVPLLPCLDYSGADSSKNHSAWEQLKRNIDHKALRYWNGWEIKSMKRNIGFLPIPLIWNSHGEDFAELIYEKYSRHFEKQASPATSELRLWLKFISENADKWPATSLQHPIKIKSHFIDFMLYNLTQALDCDCDLNSRIRNHGRFIRTIEDIFITPGLWARPFAGSLPCPAASSTPGTHTNLKKKKDGTIVKNKLITEIPLHITDAQAIELLFKKIHDDNKLVLDWAKTRLAKAEKTFLNSQALALSGKVISGGNFLKKHITDLKLEDLCKTYFEMGIIYIQAQGNKILGQGLRTQIVEHLGLPTIDIFFAFQLLLTHAHPCLTESFYTHFELYDKHGNISGFLKTNTGYQLVGYKDRKGASLSEQKIDLTPEQTNWVQFIIALTDTFRNELKERGDDSWRFLFLHSRGRMVYPTRAEAIRLNNNTIKYQETMIKEFMEVGKLTKETASQFIVRLSVTAFRASAAVEVYLKNNSVEEMARSLGHSQYSSSLLSSYLPEPILAFFQTRWIRLFQRGIICQAMKGSPKLLEATYFNNMDELHEFLRNHALRDIPEHLQNPDYLIEQKSYSNATTKDTSIADQVIVSIDAGVLTALLSLKAAVSTAKPDANLCSKAIYWSRFCDLVVRDIKTGFNSDLHNYLQSAEQHANASHMENLIYATAS
ncbi:hypothetical protein ACM714_20555 [Pseudomonas aeruginosa]